MLQPVVNHFGTVATTVGVVVGIVGIAESGLAVVVRTFITPHSIKIEVGRFVVELLVLPLGIVILSLVHT